MSYFIIHLLATKACVEREYINSRKKKTEEGKIPPKAKEEDEIPAKEKTKEAKKSCTVDQMKRKEKAVQQKVHLQVMAEALTEVDAGVPGMSDSVKSTSTNFSTTPSQHVDRKLNNEKCCEVCV